MRLLDLPHRAASLLIVLALALGVLAVTTGAASAANTASASGSITSSSPESSVIGAPGSICAAGAQSHYAVISFTLNVKENVSVSATVTPSSGMKVTAAMYTPYYISDQPQTDCLDDSAASASVGSAVTVSTSWGAVGSTPYGQNVDLVVWGTTSSDQGSFSVSLSTTGTDLVVTPPATPPADTTDPVVTVPSSAITKEASGSSGAAVSFTASATDDTDGTLTPTCTRPTNITVTSGSTFPLGTTTVTCSATDTAGNTGSASFDVTVADTTGPTITVPTGPTVEATSPSGAAVTYTNATATDAVDGTDPVTCKNPFGTVVTSDSPFAVGSTIVTCTSSDTHHNAATSKQFTVTVTDRTKPTITVPSVAPSAEATSPGGAAVTYTNATATDLVDGTDPVTCVTLSNVTVTSGATFAIGDTLVTCSATDAHHNTATAHFTVTVTDNDGPVLSLPTVPSTEATGPTTTITWVTPTAHDAVDGDEPVSCADPLAADATTGGTFPVGTTTVTCASSDQHGHTSQGTFNVVVRDTTAPTITTPTVPATAATGPLTPVSFTAPSATDLVDGTADTVTCTKPPDTVVTSGSTFPVGDTLVTCTATDTAGNHATPAHFTVTVTDTTPPAITVPTTTPTAEATGPDGATVTYTAPTASDLVDGTADTVTCTKPSDTVVTSGSTFPVGDTLVTCTATDVHHNSATTHFTVTITDTTPPTVGAIGDVTTEATSHDGAVVTYTTPGASDLVDGTADTVTCAPPNGSTFALGTTPVACTATDAHQNQGESDFTITVSDTSAPVLTLPANVTAEATGPAGAAVAYAAPTADDAVDGDRPVTCDHDPGDTFPLGTTTVSCSASDTSSHTVSSDFTVTVVDTTAPTVTVPSGLSLPASGLTGATATYHASATDLVDGALTPSCTPASGSRFKVGATTVTCSATDTAGNTGTASFAVTVRGVRAPRLTAHVTSSVHPGATGWYRKPVTVRFTCTAGTGKILSCPAPVKLHGKGKHRVSRTVRAADGGRATAAVTVKIDRTKPTIALRGAKAGHTYTGSAPTVSCKARDHLSGVASCKVSRHRSGTQYRWTAVARDRAGNVKRRTLTYRVVPAYLQGVPTQDGHAVVHVGDVYQLRVYSTSSHAPTYLYAAPEGHSPTPSLTSLRPVGGHWWALSITIDRGMANRDWVVGARVGGTSYLVKLRVLP